MADMQLSGSYPSAPDRQLAGAPLDLPEAGLPSPGRIKVKEVELRPLDTYFNSYSSIPNQDVAKKYAAFLKLANAAGLLHGSKSPAGSMSSSLAGSTGSSPLSSPRAAVPRCHNPEPSSPIPLEAVHRTKSTTYSSSATGKGGSYMQRAKSYSSIAAAGKGHNHDIKQASFAPVTSDANDNSDSGPCAGMRADAMKAAYEALNCLTRNDITEIKCMNLKNPPPGVRLVVEAVCVVMGVKPAHVKDAQFVECVDSYVAAGQKMLADDDFLRSLREFDKDNISPKTLEKISTYTSQPDLQPENIRKVSTAAYGLCCCVRGMEMYARAAKAEKAQDDKARFADYASLKSCQEDLVAPGTPPANGTASQGPASSPSRLSPFAAYQPASPTGAPAGSRTSLAQLLRDSVPAHSHIASLALPAWQKPATAPAAATPDAAIADSNGPNPAATKPGPAESALSSSLALAQNWPKRRSLVSPRSSAGGDPSPKESGLKEQLQASALAASGGVSRMGGGRQKGQLVLSFMEQVQLFMWALEVCVLLSVAFMLSVVTNGWRPLLRLVNAMVWLVGLVTLALAVYLWKAPGVMDWCSTM